MHSYECYDRMFEEEGYHEDNERNVKENHSKSENKCEVGSSKVTFSYPCETCIKSDVCVYKEDCIKALDDINKISGRINVFINGTIKCKKEYSTVDARRR